MNAPPWPPDPNVGQWFNNWIWTGSQWVAAPTTGMRVLVQTFTQSGAYQPSPGLVSLTVECIGGGGGGGGITNWPDTNWVVAGAGGGSGGYSRKTLPAALVRGGVMITVGEGGAEGQQVGSGLDGGPTSFGAFCVANGGHGGSGAVYPGGPGQNAAAGNPAAAGIGDVAMGGAGGGQGQLTAVPSAPWVLETTGGLGGAIWGGNVPTPTVNGGSWMNGSAARPNSGAGGSGAVGNQVANIEQGGGNGGSGLCVVTEYCWGDRDDVNAWSPPLNVNLNWPHPPFAPGGPWPPGLPPGPWPRSEDDC